MSLMCLTNLEISLIVILAVLVLGILCFALYYFTGKTLVGLTIKRGNYVGRAIDRKLKRLSKRYKINYKWWDKFPLELLTTKSFDDLDLYGRILMQEKKTNKFAIVVHGFMNTYKDMEQYAKYFYDRGFNVLAVDNRAHGLSGGDYVGMGWFDRLDVVNWINHLILKYGKNIQIVLLGVSMGGATVSMASGENLPANVKCIISDCAYDNVYNVFYHVMKMEFKFPAWSLVRTLEAYNKMYFGQSIKDQDTVSQVKKSKTPILFIHGEKDNFVPVEMAYKLYDAMKPELRGIYICPNAWHSESYAKDTKKYEQTVDAWISKFVK